MGRVVAYVGLGANVGDARATLTHAVAALAGLPDTHLRGVSRLFRTKPVGVAEQPDFLNAAVGLEVPAGVDPTTGATGLLVALKDLEQDFGRRARQRWGPRELDLDLLLFGDARVAIERPPEGAPLSAAVDPGAAPRLLEVPHPSMRDRLFVLAPLADLAPELVPPGWDGTIETAREQRLEVEGPEAVCAIGIWSAEERTWVGPSGQPIDVRRALPSDAEAAARAHTLSSEAAYRGLTPPEPEGLARRTAIWRQSLANPDVQGYLAVEDGRVVGVLNVGGDPEQPGVGVVRVLYVVPEWWGSGAGQLLMERAHEVLSRDYDRAELTVLTANPRARRFYERNGWVEGETLLEPHFGGTPTEVTRYRRSLRSPRQAPG